FRKVERRDRDLLQHIQPNQAGKEWLYRSIFDAANDGLIITDLETGLVVEANPAACMMHGYSREEFIGLQLTAFIHPDSQNVFSEYIRAFQSDRMLNRRTTEVRRDGSTFFAEWRGSAFTYQGRSCLLGMVRDVSKRIKAEQLLRRRVEIRSREQARLLEISHTLASTLEFQPGLILDQLREIIEYTHGGLFALEDSALVTLAMRGTPQLEQSSPIRIHLQGPETLAALFNDHKPICIADVRSDTPQAQFLRSLLEDGAAVLLKGMQSWMWVPLAVRGRIIGGIGIAETRKNYFTAHHADLALSVANQAAIAMVNAELYGRAQALAALQERQRLAQDLHDAVSQSLFSAGLIAEVLPRLWEQDPAEARRSLEDLRRLTRGALAEMRALLAELRPATLTDTELGDLLRLLGNAFTGRTNVPVIEKVTGQGGLPAETQVTFYRICQEALNNITKHSKASQVEIELHHVPAGLEMIIRDNGCGFVTSDQVPSGHYGLGMMRERAEAIGAVLTVTSQPGQGTEIAVHWGEQEGL
ncbi:MAG TPA: PAS domain S-box protein, partial [Anaerolineaceae bacterium]|nr:PAS domain S-box protein [Anaerolineaceae bacterium]